MKNREIRLRSLLKTLEAKLFFVFILTILKNCLNCLNFHLSEKKGCCLQRLDISNILLHVYYKESVAFSFGKLWNKHGNQINNWSPWAIVIIWKNSFCLMKEREGTDLMTAGIMYQPQAHNILCIHIFFIYLFSYTLYLEGYYLYTE